MIKSRLAAGVALACLAGIIGPRLDAASDPGQTRWFRYLMGTSVRVEIYNGSAVDRQVAVDEAFGAISEVDRIMSDYRADSELTEINSRAAREPVTVSAAMLAVLEAADRVSRASDGAFDITVGPLMRLWGFKDRRPHLPTATELAGIRAVVRFEHIQIDSSTRAVRFTQSGVQIDLGGIAKGFAAELAAGSLRRRGLSGLIDLGGNQYMVGRPPGKQVWSVGVRHPDLPEALLGAVEVAGGSLSTSADSSNFVTIDGRQYGHLMDPRTLQPATASLSVTIASTDGTLADALSKAVFVLGPKAGLSLLASFPGTSAVVAYREPDGHVGVVVSPSLVFHPAR